MQIVNNIIRLNKLIVGLDSIEAMEWQELFDDDEMYQIRFHTISGKLFTRKVNKEVVKELIALLQKIEVGE